MLHLLKDLKDVVKELHAKKLKHAFHQFLLIGLFKEYIPSVKFWHLTFTVATITKMADKIG